MITALLAEVDTRNCWTLAEALGHPGPHPAAAPAHPCAPRASVSPCWASVAVLVLDAGEPPRLPVADAQWWWVRTWEP